MIAKYGYCALTADFLHIGHIRFIKSCKEKCDKLIVGIMSDASVLKYKGRYPIMNEKDRREIIESLSFVHKTKIQDDFDFPLSIVSMKEAHGSDFIIFDSEEHKRLYADIIIPRTPSISSSQFRIENEDSNFSKHTL